MHLNVEKSSSTLEAYQFGLILAQLKRTFVLHKNLSAKQQISVNLSLILSPDSSLLKWDEVSVQLSFDNLKNEISPFSIPYNQLDQKE